MSQKRFFLDELLEEIRSLSEQYDTDENETDVFLLKESEINVFAEDLFKVVSEFTEKELNFKNEEEEIDDEEMEVWFDDDDEELE